MPIYQVMKIYTNTSERWDQVEAPSLAQLRSDIEDDEGQTYLNMPPSHTDGGSTDVVITLVKPSPSPLSQIYPLSVFAEEEDDEDAYEDQQRGLFL